MKFTFCNIGYNSLENKKDPVLAGPFRIHLIWNLLFGISCYTSAASANNWNGVVISVGNGNGVRLVVDATHS